MNSKTFIFAGASSAIALATAKQLQAEGHQIIGLSTKNIPNNYNEFYTINKYETEYFPKIEAQINGIVYFPGTINLKPFNRITAADFLNDYHINSLGAVAFVQAYLPNLKMSEQASIVFISTVAVTAGMPFHSSIAMAKGAVEGLTRALAAEFAPVIRVNCIAPSLTQTPLSDKFTNTPKIAIGKALEFSFVLTNEDKIDRYIRLEYTVYYLKNNGSLAGKVFKISEKPYPAGAEIKITRKQSFKLITTKTFYPGLHQLSIMVNGKEMAIADFELC